jgi:hypothetical protein
MLFHYSFCLSILKKLDNFSSDILVNTYQTKICCDPEDHVEDFVLLSFPVLLNPPFDPHALSTPCSIYLFLYHALSLALPLFSLV